MNLWYSFKAVLSVAVFFFFLFFLPKDRYSEYDLQFVHNADGPNLTYEMIKLKTRIH